MRRLTALLLTVAFLTAACGGGGGSASSSGANAGSSSSSGDGKPVVGGKLVYGLEAETAGGFCLPEAQLAISGIQVAKSVYETLAAPNEKGDYVPYLAKSITPNATNTEWTIVLRDGVKFHDGTALDATVVKNNLDSYRGKYPNRSPLLFVFVFDNIADVAVVDPTSVKVTTKTPWPAFPAYLYGSGRIGMLAQSQLDDKTSCDKSLVGTGPFKSNGPIANTQDITLVKNPTYWQKDADGVQLPYLDEIEFRAIPDDASRLNALQSKQLDMMHTDVPQVIVQLEPLVSDGSLSMTVNDEQGETAYVMFNQGRAPFDSQVARDAVTLAFNTEQYNQVQNNGLLSEAGGPFPPGNSGFLDNTGKQKFNLEAAKAKVAQYKQDTGQDLSFTLSTTDEPVTIQGAQLFQQFMKDAGMTVSLAHTNQPQLINQAIAGEFQAAGWRNHPGGDPDGQYVWWHTGSPVNFGRITDPELDKLLEDGRVSSDDAARTKIYEDVNKLFAAKNYNMWQFLVKWAVASQPTVQGIYGPDLPDGGGAPAKGLGSGHPTLGIYVSK